MTDEVKVDDEITVDGFVDCSINVKSSDYYYTMGQHRVMNDALKVTVSNYLRDKFPDVEISKIDFSLDHANEWYYHKPVKAVSRDHKFRIVFKQKGSKEDLSKKDFSDTLSDIMSEGEDIPIAIEKKYFLMEKGENVKLEYVKFVKNH